MYPSRIALPKQWEPETFHGLDFKCRKNQTFLGAQFHKGCKLVFSIRGDYYVLSISFNHEECLLVQKEYKFKKDKVTLLCETDIKQVDHLWITVIIGGQRKTLELIHDSGC